MRFAFLLFTLIFSSQVYGAVVITGFGGASRSTLAVTGTSGISASTAVVYGGTGGEVCTSATTCNSCDNATFEALCTTQPLCPCNTARIIDTGTLSIAVKRTDNSVTGAILIQYGTTVTVLLGTSTSGDTMTTTWANFCTALGATGATCENQNLTATLKLFVDKDGSGTLTTGEDSVDFQAKVLKPDPGTYAVWNNGNTDGIGGTQGFTPYPGDEKVYIEDPETALNFPALTYGNTKAKYVRVFHSEAGLASATRDSADSVDLPVQTDGAKLESNIVTAGLKNDTTYVFRVAMVDEAGNLAQFFPAVGADPTCDDAASGFANCPWAATPEKVLGLLTDDFNCFVATAAYGTALEPKLDTFREFRFKVLLQHKWGRKFVYWYYKYGSMAGRFISDKPSLRAGVRLALWPAYWFTMGSLRIGFIITLIISLLLITSCAFVFWFGTRRIFGGR
jgi:hypothetical protein